jgi:SMODS and SLOG-associating 2TM effector domain 1
MRITAEYGHGMEPAPDSEPPRGDGRIAFTFRIGVTGHRELDKPDDLRQPIREAIGQLVTLVPVAPGAGLALVVVSALAEGADRLVAEEVLAAGDDRLVLKDVLTVGDEQTMVPETVLADLDARLEVALPMDAGEYAEDFKTEESKEEFRCFLARARPGDTWKAPEGLEREEAYERAGRYVVDRCDALIAVWDGGKSRGRGGTAEIIGYAQEQGVPIAWVHTAGGPPVSYALENKRTGVVKAAAGKLCRYNAAEIDTSKFDERMRELRQELMPDIAREIPVDPLGLSRETIADWIFPYFIRADILALRYQHRFRWLSLAIFALAALAVAVVAVQTNFWPGLNWLAAFEVVFLGTLLGILMMSRRLRLYDQWISSRFLAERLRSSYFLALARTGDRRGRSPRLAYLSDSSEAWIERALTEVSARRPELDSGAPPVRALRDYLTHCWIENQISYQEKTSRRQHTIEHRLIRLTEFLFSVTLVAAFVHIFAGAIHGFWEHFIVVVSIAVPAFGAAVHGFSTQRQFRRHSERYRRMAGVLAQVQAEMTDATTIEQVRDVAAATEQIMREENSDWFGVMRFHDMELIT